MKSYTDIEQSKRLAEILPFESADMYWRNGVSDKYIQCFTPFVIDEDGTNVDFDYDVPCWSLAALLDVIRETIGYTIYGVNNVYMSCDLGDKPWKLETEVYDNEVDACVDMIIKLHEQKIL